MSYERTTSQQLIDTFNAVGAWPTGTPREAAWQQYHLNEVAHVLHERGVELEYNGRTGAWEFLRTEDEVLAALTKADADAFFFFQKGQKNVAFDVLQDRRETAKQWLRDHGRAIPRLLSSQPSAA